MKNLIIKNAIINALATTLYIVFIASFFFYAPQIMPKEENEFLIPVMMLLLFVFSAGVTGMLVFGRPIMWYLDGKKHEAVMLIAATLVALLVITVITFATLVLCTGL